MTGKKALIVLMILMLTLVGCKKEETPTPTPTEPPTATEPLPTSTPVDTPVPKDEPTAVPEVEPTATPIPEPSPTEPPPPTMAPTSTPVPAVPTTAATLVPTIPATPQQVTTQIPPGGLDVLLNNPEVSQDFKDLMIAYQQGGQDAAMQLAAERGLMAPDGRLRATLELAEGTDRDAVVAQLQQLGITVHGFSGNEIYVTIPVSLIQSMASQPGTLFTYLSNLQGVIGVLPPP